MSTTLPEIFLSYARGDDEPFVKRLYEDLIAVGFDVWFDRVSMPSRQLTFLQEIRDTIAARQRLLLVVGPKAVTSDYVTQEWQFAYFAANKCVNPIVRLDSLENGRKVDAYEELIPEELKLLHAEDFRDNATYDMHLKNLVQQLKEELPPVGKLVAVPELPPGYRAQPHRLKALRDLLLLDLQKPVVVSGAAARVGLQGMGGIGKSVMANALAHHPEVQRAFTDGVFWISLGQGPDVAALQRWLAKELGDDGQFNDTAVGKERLRERLKERAVLLILDDVWVRDHAEAFNVVGARGRILLTTRDAGLVTALAAKENHYRVELPTMAEAEAILAATSRQAPEKMPPEAREIIVACGRLPLALALCGGMVQTGISWRDLLDALNEHDLEYLSTDHPAEDQHQNVWRAMDVSVRLLPEEQRLHFAELAVFGKDAAIPEEAVVTLWEHTGSLPPRLSRKLLAELVQRSLVQRLSGEDTEQGGIRINLHDLLHSFAEGIAEKRFSSRVALHQTLLEAYRKKCPNGFHSGPNDGYFFDHLAHHLAVVGDYPELRALFANQKWMNVRVPASGYVYYGYTADLARAWELANNKALNDEAYLADYVRFCLIRTSINSLSGNYIPELVLAAVKSGLWSAERAIDVTDKMPDKVQSCRTHALLLGTVPLSDIHRSHILSKTMEIACSIRDEQKRAEALTELAEQLSGPEKAVALQQALEAACAIAGHDPEAWRSLALIEIARHMGGPDSAAVRQQALETACATEKEHWRSLALVAVAEQLRSPEDATGLRQALEAACFIKDERRRVQILAALAGQLNGPEKATALQQALDTACSIKEESFRAEALATVVKQLHGHENTIALRQALDAIGAIGIERWWEKALAVLAGHLSGPKKSALRQSVNAAYARGRRGWRLKVLEAVVEQSTGLAKARTLLYKSQALTAAAEQLSGPEKTLVLRQAVDAACAIKDEGPMAEALAEAVEQLGGPENETVLQKAQKSACAIKNEGLRAEMLVAVAGHLNGHEKTTALKQAVDAACAIEDEELRVVTLATVAGLLSDSEKAIVLRQAVEVARAIEDKVSKVEALVTVVRLLSDPEKASVLRQAVEVACSIEEGKAGRAESLAAVARQLGGSENKAVLNQFLDATCLIKDERAMAKALSVVTEHLRGQENAAAMDKIVIAICTIMDEPKRAETLIAVAGQLDSSENETALQQALNTACTIEEEGRRARALAVVTGQLGGTGNTAALHQALDAAYAIKDGTYRAMALASVARHLSGPEKVLALQPAVEALKQALGTVRLGMDMLLAVDTLITVVGQLGGPDCKETLQHALEVACSIEDASCKARVLVAVADQLNESEKTSVLRWALEAACSQEQEPGRAWQLAVIAKKLGGSENIMELRQILDAAYAIKDGENKAKVLAAVAEQLDDPEKTTVLRHALEAASTCNSYWLRSKAHQEMSKHLKLQENSTTLQQILEACSITGQEAWRSGFMTTAGTGQSFDPIRLKNAVALQQAIKTACAIENERSRVDALAEILVELDTSTAVEYFLACIPSMQDSKNADDGCHVVLHFFFLACIRWMQDSKRKDFLYICEKLFSSPSLQPETYEAIAKHLIEICGEWKWM